MGRLTFEPLGPSQWKDLVKLFGPRGACAGCWCMWWRVSAAGYKSLGAEGRRRALRRLAAAGEPPGILAYRDGVAIGWCAVAPRERCVRLERSEVLAPVDDRRVWSIPCFFVARGHRRAGLTGRLLRAAVAYARRRGARVVEGYPVDAAKKQPDPFVYTGLASTFRAAGFTEAARRSESRPIMRKVTRRS